MEASRLEARRWLTLLDPPAVGAGFSRRRFCQRRVEAVALGRGAALSSVAAGPLGRLALALAALAEAVAVVMQVVGAEAAEVAVVAAVLEATRCQRRYRRTLLHT